MPPEQNYVPALGYHWLTPLYDVVVGATTRERHFKQALIQQASFAPGQRVLDLASGTGTLAIWIKQHEPLLDVTGVDADPDILATATLKARAAKVEIQFDRALSYSLPYPAVYFDRVVSSLFFHHLSWQDKLRTAQELFRVLKPGGVLHVADWGRPANLVMRGLFLMIQFLDGFETTRDNAAGRLVSLFEDAGFVDVLQRQTFSTIFGTMALYRAAKPAFDETDGRAEACPILHALQQGERR
ncbi:MAG TPA: methyltransferase domain-containing protein [Steroidobacteraceae bacterium]